MEKNKDEAESLRSWLNNKFGLCEKKRYDVVRPLGRGTNRANIPKELFIKKFVNY